MGKEVMKDNGATNDWARGRDNGMNGNSTMTVLLTFCPQSFFFHIAAPDCDPFAFKMDVFDCTTMTLFYNASILFSVLISSAARCCFSRVA